MKVHVVADADGNVVGTMMVRPPTPEGHSTAIFPAEEGHVLHRLDVPDAYGSLQADEFHQRLQEHLGGSPSA
jgi:hypothetical protein